MKSYVTDQYEHNVSCIRCGTSGCLLGHATHLVVAKPFSWSFDRYCYHVFGILAGRDAYLYLFGPDWPNSQEHAIHRIKTYLASGVPKDFDYGKDTRCLSVAIM